MENKSQVFLSYATEDVVAVRELYSYLLHAGFRPWMDKMDILAGQVWEDPIREAILNSDFFLPCLSKHSVNRRGYFQREIKYAFDLWTERFDSDLYVIPVRLEESEVPENLRRLQYVDLFEDEGYIRLLSALRLGMERKRSKFELIQSLYHLDNVRALLIDDFNIQDLRLMFYEVPSLRALYEHLLRNASQSELVKQLIDAADSRSQLEAILTWVEEHEPQKYARHRPYHTEEFRSDDHFGTAPAVRTEPLDNPYVVGNPIQPSNMKVFLGRFDIANSIINEVRKGSQKPSILLYGRRRMGKTSALLNISNLVRDPSFIHVYISGQSVKFHTNVNFCFYLVQAINDRLQEESIDTTIFQGKGFLNKTSFDKNPLLTLSEFFDEFEKLLEARSIYCLLAIDEYEEIDSHINLEPGIHDNSITRDLLLELRDTLQHKPRLMFLFAGTHFLRELSNVDWSSIFINVKTLHISFLERRDSALLLTQPVPEMKYKSQALVEKILDLTGCQPLLVQAIASELINTLNFKGERMITEAVLKAAIGQVLVKQNTYFDYIWDLECSSPKHRDLLKTISRIPTGVQESTLIEYQDELRDLVRKEVVYIDSGKARLTMPILKLWMKKNQYIL